MSDIFSDSLNYLSSVASANNAWSAAQAQKQMDFQERMSNTAHQREVSDLKAAGLNPILSANSGAQAMNGASAQADQSLLPSLVSILDKAVDANMAAAQSGLANASWSSSLSKTLTSEGDSNSNVKLSWSKNNLRSLLGNFLIRAVEGFEGKNMDDVSTQAGSHLADLVNFATGKGSWSAVQNSRSNGMNAILGLISPMVNAVNAIDKLVEDNKDSRKSSSGKRHSGTSGSFGSTSARRLR